MGKRATKFNIYSIALNMVLQAWGLSKQDIGHNRYCYPSQVPPTNEQHAVVVDEIGKAISKKISDNTKNLLNSYFYSNASTVLTTLHNNLQIVAKLVDYTESFPDKPNSAIKGEIYGYATGLLLYALNLQHYIDDGGEVIDIIKASLEDKLPAGVVEIPIDIERLLNQLAIYISGDRPFWELMRKLQRIISGLQDPPRDNDTNNDIDL